MEQQKEEKSTQSAWRRQEPVFFAKFSETGSTPTLSSNSIPGASSSTSEKSEPTDPLGNLSTEEKKAKGEDHKNKGNTKLNEKKNMKRPFRNII